MEAPKAKRIEKKLTSPHGDIRIDPYYWMKERENPEVIAYLEAENQYTDSFLRPTEQLQEDLFKEITSRIKKDESTVPYKKDGYYYYTRFEKGSEHPIFCRKHKSLQNPEEIMLDVNILAKDYSYCQVGSISVSTNNHILAYSLDTLSRRKFDIHFKDLRTGREYKDIIANTSGSISWANDNKTVFYVRKHEETLLPYKVYRHALGTSGDDDMLVYEEKDNTFYTSCFKCKSKKYIMLSINSTMTSEYRFLDADEPEGKFKVLQKRQRGIEYDVSHYGDEFYIYTNYQAKNFRLMKAGVENCGIEMWKK